MKKYKIQKCSLLSLLPPEQQTPEYVDVKNNPYITNVQYFV